MALASRGSIKVALGFDWITPYNLSLHEIGCQILKNKILPKIKKPAISFLNSAIAAAWMITPGQKKVI